MSVAGKTEGQGFFQMAALHPRQVAQQAAGEQVLQQGHQVQPAVAQQAVAAVLPEVQVAPAPVVVQPVAARAADGRDGGGEVLWHWHR